MCSRAGREPPLSAPPRTSRWKCFLGRTRSTAPRSTGEHSLAQIPGPGLTARAPGIADMRSEKLPAPIRIARDLILAHREADGATFDWFKSYSDIAHILHDVVPDRSSRILMLGCGNSTLSEDVSVLRLASFVLLSSPLVSRCTTTDTSTS